MSLNPGGNPAAPTLALQMFQDTGNIVIPPPPIHAPVFPSPLPAGFNFLEFVGDDTGTTYTGFYGPTSGGTIGFFMTPGGLPGSDDTLPTGITYGICLQLEGTVSGGFLFFNTGSGWQVMGA